MFGQRKVARKKNGKTKYFLKLDCNMKNIKENQIYLKLVRNLSILKLFKVCFVMTQISNNLKLDL